MSEAAKRLTTYAMLGASLTGGAQAEECGQFFHAPGCERDDCAAGDRPIRSEPEGEPVSDTAFDFAYNAGQRRIADRIKALAAPLCDCGEESCVESAWRESLLTSVQDVPAVYCDRGPCSSMIGHEGACTR